MITPFRKHIHIIFETLAVFVVAPILGIFLYSHWHKLNCFYKAFFMALIIGTLIVDGYLLLMWS